MITQLPDFSKSRVLVVGDVMLDRYWRGHAARISPEAPVPVVNVQHHEYIPGGAANVAVNAAALGAHVTLLGLIGKDDAAIRLASLLDEAGVTHDLTPTEQATITKLRVLSHDQQLLRMDFETPYEATHLPDLMATLETHLKNADILVLSDYGKGTLAQAKDIIALAKRYKVPVFVDPKTDDIHHYQGATLVTPNFKEFQAFVGPISSEADFVEKTTALIQSGELSHILVTRGEKGMTLVEPTGEVSHFPTQAKEVYDVTGAGDTVMATLACAYASGCDLNDAVRLANIAAGIVVGKLGTAFVTPAELLLQISQDSRLKIFNLPELMQLVEAAKAHGQKIVMTNGCFDLLHAGHVQYLQQAKALGDKLIIAVNSDASVAGLKGPTRPINALPDRMAVLGGLEAVDWLVSFEQDTPASLIEQILPDVLVKGGDYTVSQIAGHEAVLAQGGEVIILPFKPGCSTTGMIERMITKEH